MPSTSGTDAKDFDPPKVELALVEDVAARIDHDMTAWQCIRRNPKAVLWTLYANIGSTLVGYENLVLSVCLAMPAFQAKFATDVGGELIIPAFWQAAWNASFNVMQLCGSLAAGLVQDLYGRRAGFLMGIIIMSAGIATAYVSETAAHFLGAKIITGFAIGAVLTTTQTYVSEMAPMPMRGIALSFNIVMMNLGFLIAISSTFSRIAIMNPSAFRVIFAAAWTFPGLLALGLPFLPESAYWLVTQDKPELAVSALKKISAGYEDIDARLQHIQDLVDGERRRSTDETSFLECFRGGNWRRTRIILICMYMPQVVGAVLASNAPYFLNQTGLSSSTVVILMQVGCVVSIVSSLLNIAAMMRFRHRALMFFGISVCVAVYLTMGIAACLPQSNTTLMVIGFALQCTSIAFGPAVGSAYAISGEVSAIRLRAKSQGIAFSWQALVSTVWTIVLPYMFNKDQGNMGGHLGWVFFGMAIIMAVVVYFDVPGTKGRTFHELDIMFEHKVPARKFERYQF